MSEESIAPVRHGLLSSVGGTTAGAIGGGLRSGVKAIAYTAMIGAVIGAIWFSGGLGLLAAAQAATLSATLGEVLLGGLLGGLGGVVLGSFVSPFSGTLGAIFGGSRAASRIREEKGAANMLDAQLSAYQAQAAAMQPQPTNVYAPSATSTATLPASGSTMNMASPQIQADSATNLGTINGEHAMARA